MAISLEENEPIIRLLESNIGTGYERIDEEAGVIYGVRVINLQSLNGRRYRESALREKLYLYEGAKVNLNHVRQKPGAIMDRSLDDFWGELRNVRWHEGVVGGDEPGMIADLHFLKTHEKTPKLLEAARRFPDKFGLSHDASGEEVQTSNGREVVEIYEVHSVDLVSNPATTNGLFESVNMTEAFCPTGDGGGKKNTCSPKKSGSNSGKSSQKGSGTGQPKPLWGEKADGWVMGDSTPDAITVGGESFEKTGKTATFKDGAKAIVYQSKTGQKLWGDLKSGFIVNASQKPVAASAVKGSDSGSYSDMDGNVYNALPTNKTKPLKRKEGWGDKLKITQWNQKAKVGDVLRLSPGSQVNIDGKYVVTKAGDQLEKWQTGLGAKIGGVKKFPILDDTLDWNGLHISASQGGGVNSVQESCGMKKIKDLTECSKCKSLQEMIVSDPALGEVPVEGVDAMDAAAQVDAAFRAALIAVIDGDMDTAQKLSKMKAIFKAKDAAQGVVGDVSGGMVPDDESMSEEGSEMESEMDESVDEEMSAEDGSEGEMGDEEVMDEEEETMQESVKTKLEKELAEVKAALAYEREEKKVVALLRESRREPLPVRVKAVMALTDPKERTALIESFPAVAASKNRPAASPSVLQESAGIDGAYPTSREQFKRLLNS